MRGATVSEPTPTTATTISTHTPHARCDTQICTENAKQTYFYSHTSCEVRQSRVDFFDLDRTFLLTHLMRGATETLQSYTEISKFLLTHLMRGATFY